jgi:hypothetical protein
MAALAFVCSSPKSVICRIGYSPRDGVAWHGMARDGRIIGTTMMKKKSEN